MEMKVEIQVEMRRRTDLDKFEWPFEDQDTSCPNIP